VQRLAVDVEVKGDYWDITVRRSRTEGPLSSRPSTVQPSRSLPAAVAIPKAAIPVHTSRPAFTAVAPPPPPPSSDPFTIAPLSSVPTASSAPAPMPRNPHFIDPIRYPIPYSASASPPYSPTASPNSLGRKRVDHDEDHPVRSSFRYWLSLFPEHTIPMPFREVMF